MLEYLRIMLDARRDSRSERGASAVEYGLLIAGISALIIVAVFAFGGAVLHDLVETTCDSVGSSTGNSCAGP
jgi:pilus assembly protein Flp/PilA